MELYEVVGWAFFALIFVFVGMVLGATWKQVEAEARDAGLVNGRGSPRDARRARERARAARPRRRPRA